MKSPPGAARLQGSSSAVLGISPLDPALDPAGGPALWKPCRVIRGMGTGFGQVAAISPDRAALSWSAAHGPSGRSSP